VRGHELELSPLWGFCGNPDCTQRLRAGLMNGAPVGLLHEQASTRAGLSAGRKELSYD
jgi:hypothetical protein